MERAANTVQLCCLLLLGTFSLTGCAAMVQKSAALIKISSYADWQGEVDRANLPVPLFPTATVVKTYDAFPQIVAKAGYDEGLLVGKDGSVRDDVLDLQEPTPDGSYRHHLEPAKFGGDLTPVQLAELRGSLRLAPAPPVANACMCESRHAFVFFDAKGRFLGDFLVCFHCGCMDVEPLAPHRQGWDTIVANEAVLRSIFEVHHLPVSVSP